MHDALLSRLAEATGLWQGEGVTADGRPFEAHLRVQTAAAGRGVTLHYLASAADGATLHDEILLLGPHAMGRLGLWTLSGEIDAVLEHLVRRTDGTSMWVFGFGLREDREGFRQELTLAFQRDGAFAIRHAFGLPGQAIQDGSTATFRPAPGTG